MLAVRHRRLFRVEGVALPILRRCVGSTERRVARMAIEHLIAHYEDRAQRELEAAIRRAEVAEAALLRLRQQVADLGRDAERGGGYWTAIKDVLACLDTI